MFLPATEQTGRLLPVRVVRSAAALLVLATVLCGTCPARAQVSLFPAAPAGRVETGAPLFVVLGPEALGLRSAPTDFHLLSDGRLLLVAPQELAVGDGFRWSVVEQASGEPASAHVSVAVDLDGSIYAGIPGGFARLEFGRDGFWRATSVAGLPVGEAQDRPVLREVAAADGMWFWHSESGSLIAWRPGVAARVAERVGTFGHLFLFGGRIHLSDQADGSLCRIEADGSRQVLSSSQVTPDDSITCSTPLGVGALLVGTHARGLAVFDGKELRPFPVRGLLASGQRINALCATEGDCFAAAVENVGIVFFDRQGRTLQVLDRLFDHRLARPRRLQPMPGGVIWVLLTEGLARVAFPSRVSYFDPMIPTGMNTAHPFRDAGGLWVMAEGKAQRGIYDAEGRLLRFEIDSPPGRFVFAFFVITGAPLVGTEAGLYRRTTAGWVRVSPADLVNARILSEHPVGGRWLYAARGELGWLWEAGERIELERHPGEGLANVGGAVTERDGTVWLELGVGQIGRVTFDLQGGPRLAILTAQQGVAEGWAQVFEIDGVAGFNVADRVYRYEPGAARVVPDPGFLARLPAVGLLVGRPQRDALGRLWVGGGDSVQVYDDRRGKPELLPVAMPAGLRPYYFTSETDGVVWVRGARRLLRYDPRMPEAVPAPLRAIIAEVTLTASNRTILRVGEALPPLAAADNSLAVRLMASGGPVGVPVVLEAMLEGAGREWVPTGASGTAVYTRLKEGDYRLRVRPRAGALLGEEATLAITVLAPWYRTPWAYAGFALSALGFAGGVVWYGTARQRREKARLACEVAARTAELHDTNRQLLDQIDQTLRQAAELQASEERARRLNATLRVQMEETMRKALELQASEERYRRLSEELERRVAARTAELHGANAQLMISNRELEAFSYSVSHDLRAPLRNISGFADLLRRRISGRGDAEGDRFLETVSAEAQRLGQLIDSLLGFSRLGRAEMRRGPVDLRILVDAARAELGTEQSGRQVDWRIGALPVVDGDTPLLRQVFVNLLGNALKFTRDRVPAVIEIGARESAGGAGEVLVYLRDNGAGFDARYADKLFGVFQRLHSAKEFSGTGIGLANVRRIINRHGGHVWAEGAVGRGATFYFTLPLSAPGTSVRPAGAERG